MRRAAMCAARAVLTVAAIPAWGVLCLAAALLVIEANARGNVEGADDA